MKNKKKGKKAYLEISFGWLFAIIAGVFILSLAIFLVTKMINLGETTVAAETGEEIEILLNPLETGFEEAKTTSFTLQTETRIHNICYDEGDFGEQRIQLSQKSFNQWKETDLEASFENKYIFSDDVVEGKTFYVFSKPFEFPFKVSDLILLTSSSKKYCFVDAPKKIQNEISYLGQEQENLLLENCPAESIKICFSYGLENCDIEVGADYVEKEGKKMYFEGDALMYAAILSSPEVYECQVKRLMKRLDELALLYKEKGAIMMQRGCNFNFGNDLVILSSSAESLSKSSSLDQIKNIADDLENKNNAADCRLW